MQSTQSLIVLGLLLCLGCTADGDEDSPVVTEDAASQQDSASQDATSQDSALQDDAGNLDAALGDTGPRQDAEPAPKQLVVGTGWERFEPIAGGVLPIQAGFQGGYHVFGSFQVTDIDPSEVFMRFELRIDGAVAAEAGWITQLESVGGAYEMLGVNVIFDTEPLDYDGRAAELWLRLEDSTGLVIEDSAQVTLECCAFDVGGFGGEDGDGGGGEGGGPPPDRNAANLRIHAVTATRRTIALGGETELEVIAASADDELSYRWSGEGTFDEPTSYSTTWRPATEGTHRLRIEVTDSAGSARAAIDITVE